MKDEKQQHEVLLLTHSDVARSTRKIAEFIVEKISDSVSDEKDFYKVMQQSDRASLTLQRLCSILTQIIPLEHNILSQQLDINKSSSKEQDITRQDCEIILNIVRQWGLLKDDCDDEIENIINKYEAGNE